MHNGAQLDIAMCTVVHSCGDEAIYFRVRGAYSRLRGEHSRVLDSYYRVRDAYSRVRDAHNTLEYGMLSPD